MRGIALHRRAKPERAGVLALVQQPLLDRVRNFIRELRLDDELVVGETLDAALRRICSAFCLESCCWIPRVLTEKYKPPP